MVTKDIFVQTVESESSLN